MSQKHRISDARPILLRLHRWSHIKLFLSRNTRFGKQSKRKRKGSNLVSVNKYTGTASYSEAVHGPLQLSILRPNGENYDEMCRPFVCKDFLQDAFYAEFVGEPCGIWGFHWEPKILGKQDRYNFAVRYGNDEIAKQASGLQKMLSLWDKQFGFEPTKVIDTDDARTKVVNFSVDWVSQPIRVSLFSLLLRLGPSYAGETSISEFTKNVSQKTTTIRDDSGYIKECLKKFDTLAEKGWPKQKYEDYKGQTHTLHHGSGIVCWNGKYPYGNDGRKTG